MNIDDPRPLCILYSSCLGDGLRILLLSSDEFNSKYRLVCHLFYQVSNIIHLPECDREACRILLHHNSECITYPQELLDEYESVLSSVPSETKKVSFPMPQFHAFWPFHAHEPRNGDTNRPFNRWGWQSVYEYGDGYVLEALKKGRHPNDIIQSYIEADVAELVDLDSLLASSLSRISRNERSASIKIADFVDQHFRQRKLFSSVNHITNMMLLEITNQILVELECSPLPQNYIERFRILISAQNPYEVPVHPSIWRFFGAEYINEESRYIVDGRRKLTFEEYLRGYVNFE